MDLEHIREYLKDLDLEGYLRASASPNNMSGQEVWPSHVEDSFLEAVQLFATVGQRKYQIDDSDSNEKPAELLGRNDIISRYIYMKTKEFRARKQVSSHIQVWAHCKKPPSNHEMDIASFQEIQKVFRLYYSRPSTEFGQPKKKIKVEKSSEVTSFVSCRGSDFDAKKRKRSVTPNTLGLGVGRSAGYGSIPCTRVTSMDPTKLRESTNSLIQTSYGFGGAPIPQRSLSVHAPFFNGAFPTSRIGVGRDFSGNPGIDGRPRNLAKQSSPFVAQNSYYPETWFTGLDIANTKIAPSDEPVAYRGTCTSRPLAADGNPGLGIPDSISGTSFSSTDLPTMTPESSGSLSNTFYEDAVSYNMQGEACDRLINQGLIEQWCSGAFVNSWSDFCSISPDMALNGSLATSSASNSIDPAFLKSTSDQALHSTPSTNSDEQSDYPYLGEWLSILRKVVDGQEPRVC
ncbi:hypothetical protein H4219_001545 [Mycoemilia scoparia]|uniref:TEA domain-containing protein n=1 Tax=Mycoemilia scoparia TaxID=417184 RepID=A0A9W8A0A2_9FUNG|nr:hypothetical protein H4219_001545 [Mycoemilia scoparia]